MRHLAAFVVCLVFVLGVGAPGFNRPPPPNTGDDNYVLEDETTNSSLASTSTDSSTEDDNSTMSLLNETSTTETTTRTTSTTSTSSSTTTTSSATSTVSTTSSTSTKMVTSKNHSSIVSIGDLSTAGSSEGGSKWIIGVIVGAIIGLGLLIALIVVLVTRKQRKKAKREDGDSASDTRMTTTHGRSMVQLVPGLRAHKISMDVTIAPKVATMAEPPAEESNGKAVELQVSKKVAPEKKSTAPMPAKTEDQRKSVTGTETSVTKESEPTPHDAHMMNGSKSVSVGQEPLKEAKLTATQSATPNLLQRPMDLKSTRLQSKAVKAVPKETESLELKQKMTAAFVDNHSGAQCQATGQCPKMTVFFEFNPKFVSGTGISKGGKDVHKLMANNDTPYWMKNIPKDVQRVLQYCNDYQNQRKPNSSTIEWIGRPNANLERNEFFDSFDETDDTVVQHRTKLDIPKVNDVYHELSLISWSTGQVS